MESAVASSCGFIAFVVMASLALGITLLGTGMAGASALTRLPGIRYGQPLMIVGLFAYLVEKEAHLRHLSLLLITPEGVAVERERERLAELLEVDRINTALASDVEYEVARLAAAPSSNACERSANRRRDRGATGRHPGGRRDPAHDDLSDGRADRGRPPCGAGPAPAQGPLGAAPGDSTDPDPAVGASGVRSVT